MAHLLRHQLSITFLLAQAMAEAGVVLMDRGFIAIPKIPPSERTLSAACYACCLTAQEFLNTLTESEQNKD